MQFDWEDRSEIAVRVEEYSGVLISANAASLRSLVNHLNSLANVPGCNHFHLDKYNFPEKGPADLIAEKAE